jgi:hypothetical protein
MEVEYEKFKNRGGFVWCGAVVLQLCSGIGLRGGRVCLDNLKQVLSDKLLRFMPLPLSAVV